MYEFESCNLFKQHDHDFYKFDPENLRSRIVLLKLEKKWSTNKTTLDNNKTKKPM